MRSFRGVVLVLKSENVDICLVCWCYFDLLFDWGQTVHVLKEYRIVLVKRLIRSVFQAYIDIHSI